ncbi:hypothetical protein SDC9_85956 [bioreactor metagenome]|uniref:Uncharacterized protein n=1 Tax=bioreactor metagenome TaxID=1076179 RepID=A0A644ZKV9_9ZZZZ
MLKVRTDENQTFFCAAFSQLAVFRKETITWVNGVSVVFAGNSHNVFNVQVGFNRTFASTDHISFVSFVAMQ